MIDNGTSERVNSDSIRRSILLSANLEGIILSRSVSSFDFDALDVLGHDFTDFPDESLDFNGVSLGQHPHRAVLLVANPPAHAVSRGNPPRRPPKADPLDAAAKMNGVADHTAW